MAAVSTAPATSSSLTPPTSSHGNHNAWHYAVPSSSQETPHPKTNDLERSQPPHINGGAPLRHSNSRPDFSTRRTDTHNSSRSAEGSSSNSAYLAPARLNALQHKDSSISETGSAPDSLLDLYSGRGGNMSVGEQFVERRPSQTKNGDAYDEVEDVEHSRWIHRDKLAKIESQELQQAGIILPRTRATSKSSRRDASRDQQGNGIRSEQAQKRQRMNSIPNEAEERGEESHQWDLRTPEEAAEDQGDPYKELNGKQGVSRIPVCKSSPAPIALTHLERDTPIRRRMSNGVPGEEEGLAYSKVRGRRQSVKTLDDNTPISSSPPVAIKKHVPESPTKRTPTRVTSSAGNRSASATQRPKTRSGRDVSGPRPTTRSGEIGAVSANRPEGDPPWLASMYKPDPMLPPDQQLLPTVAKRLQQEQWEREGKFGTAYDTHFRPLNDDQPKPRPESMVLQKSQSLEVPDSKMGEKDAEKDRDAQWPLKSLPPKSPTLSSGRPGTAGQQSYSVMPKIHTGIPQGVGPLPSPRLQQQQPPVRVQEAPDSGKKSSGGCGCCVVM